jgi:hypothetical protein
MTFRTSVGIAYGTLLGLLAFLAAGAGHGTYIPLGVSSAPAGFLGVAAAVIGAPILWGVVGAAARNNQRMVALLVHYVSAVWLMNTEAFGDWPRVSEVMHQTPSIVGAWACLYFGGQLFVWMSFLRWTRFGGRR